MSIMKLATDLSEGTGKERTKSLFLTSGYITKDTNVLREDIFTGSENGDRILVNGSCSWSVR